MSANDERTFSLPAEQPVYIDTLVQSGRYATGGEVVREGLRALEERDAVIERWLREDVAPVAIAMRADPSRALAIDQVFDDIRALHVARVSNSVRD